MGESFDFIVVGGGTAGCLLANRLAATASKPSILLIEVGGENSEIDYLSPYERFLTAFIRPDLNHGYMTLPQPALDGLQLPYARGKGLGGSSAINFMVYTRGSAGDYDHWADVTGDTEWSWSQVKRRFKNLESFTGIVPEGLDKYAQPDLESYGHSGPVGVSLPNQWEPETTLAMDALTEMGFPLNMDSNSGDPTGVSLGANSSNIGLRTTSSSVHLKPGNVLPNLTVWTHTRAAKVDLKGKRAVGVTLSDGRKVFARKEVILSAGAIDTPKLLLLSGIGPSEELVEHGIKVQHQLPNIGKNLHDHCGVFLAELVNPGYTTRVEFAASAEKMASAKEQWEANRTGPLTEHFASAVLSFVKDSDLYQSEEFKALPAHVQGFIREPTMPIYEFVTNGPLVPPTYVFRDSSHGFLSNCIILMNPQSRGSIKLQSSDPNAPPLIDMAYMSHPYDRRVLIEGVRKAMQIRKTQTMSKFYIGAINVPATESDEDIWAFIKTNLSPIWHANGSVMMGNPDVNKDACVDSKLRVLGLESLRVADLSICPTTPSSHTQATAYLIGEFAAEEIIKEYGLDG